MKTAHRAGLGVCNAEAVKSVAHERYCTLQPETYAASFGLKRLPASLRIAIQSLGGSARAVDTFDQKHTIS